MTKKVKEIGDLIRENEQLHTNQKKTKEEGKVDATNQINIWRKGGQSRLP